MFNENEYQHPLDDVDWRWRRVMLICEDRVAARAGKSLDDRWVTRGAKFLRALRATSTRAEQYTVALDYPETSEAFGFYVHPGGRRQYIEALLLCADQTPGDVAHYMGVPERTVITYSKLFFDVADHLNDKGYLCTKILEPAMIHQLNDAKTPEFTWKLCAIFGGADVVKGCWEYQPTSPDVDGFHKRAGMSQMYKNFGIAQYCRPINKYTAAEVTDHMLRILELEMKALETANNSEATTEGAIIKDLLNACTVHLTDPEKKYTLEREPRLWELAASVEA